jgi:hypothetical protein
MIITAPLETQILTQEKPEPNQGMGTQHLQVIRRQLTVIRMLLRLIHCLQQLILLKVTVQLILLIRVQEVVNIISILMAIKPMLGGIKLTT